MKNLILLLALIATTQAYAVTLEITKVCENGPYFEQEIPVLTLTNALDFTAYHLKNAGVPHQVTESGVVSILNVNSAYEYISDGHLKVYGWCYEVNGVVPPSLPGNFTIDPECDDHIRWFYGYAELQDGTWLNYCKPVYIEQNPFICQ